MSAAAPSHQPLPGCLLYATSARIGGIGLDLDTEEQLKLPLDGGFLGKAVAYQNRSAHVPAGKVRSLRLAPVRLISFLDPPYYYGAKRRYAARVAADELRTGRYDFFHGWGGDSLAALRVAGAMRIPSVLDIPTCHVAHGFRQHATVPRAGGLAGRLLSRRWLERLPITPALLREEYEHASVLLTRSAFATETFLQEGFAPERVFNAGQGTDPARFQPGESPPLFRALFVGALIKRKGVHLLLEAWSRLGLRDAELVLAGHVHDEIRPFLTQFANGTVRVLGKTEGVQHLYRSATVHIFPSQCEGCAKTTCEAAASGLPQITTRESGDVVVDGLNGFVVPRNDLDALCARIRHLYDHPELLVPMGRAARTRALEYFTWDHYRARLAEGYRRGMALGPACR